VGFGSIAEHSHLPAWQSLPHIEIVAVADVAASRRDRVRALLPQAELFETSETLIGQAGLDIVDICTPPASHAALLLAACARAIPDIVCEKPLVLTQEEYRRVAQARNRSGSRIVSVNNWVHSDLNRHVSAVLRSGTIGSVRKIDVTIGRPDCALGNEGWNPRWRTSLSHAGGGIILDHGWHQIYLLMGWMGSRPTRVSAHTRTANSVHLPVEDEARIELAFPGGRGTIELKWTTQRRTNEGTIEGDHGVIRTFDDRLRIENGTGPRELPYSRKLSASSYHPEWFRAVFQYNVLEESRVEADRNFAEAGALVNVIRGAYRSAAREGQACSLGIERDDRWLSKETAVGNGCNSGGGSPS